MNMFVLDEQPQKAAEFHCNKHVVKMILEAGQMGCATHWMSWLDKFNKTLANHSVHQARVLPVDST